MGAVTFSIDIRLVDFFKKELKSDLFIETGTFEGGTVDQIIDLFPEVYSIELSEPYYQKAVEKFKDQKHVRLLFDDSPVAINALARLFADRATLFWLDAHWCVAENTAGQSSQCPLIEELIAIGQLNRHSAIIIDDARLFLSAPPIPHEVKQWPTFDTIIRQLYSLSDEHCIAVINDCIVFYPRHIDQAMQAYSHQCSVDWLHLLNLGRQSQELLIELERKEAVIQGLIQPPRAVDKLFSCWKS